MMRVVQATPEHIKAVVPLEPAGQVPQLAAQRITEIGEAWAVLDGDKVVMTAGAYERWHGNAIAWALVDEQASLRQMVYATRATQRWLNECPYRRVELTVNTNFVSAQDWAEKLGFRLEALLRKYGPRGEDHFLYSYVK